MIETGRACDLARAKVNLFLHITGRRADGYHTLDSLVAFADIGDELRAELADDVSLDVVGEGAASLSGDDNLVLTAARAMREEFNVKRGAALQLVKALPIAGGLGGGSADAAAAIRLLCRLWNLEPDRDRLAALALTLGADVPVCLSGTPSRMQGIGERLTPLESFPNVPVVLANPRIPLATPDVFRRTDVHSGSIAWPEQGLADAETLVSFLSSCGNDLQPAAVALVPEIAVVLDTIAACHGCRLARMSGSGASCFGLFASQTQASAAATRIRAEHPDWWVDSGHLLGAPA